VLFDTRRHQPRSPNGAKIIVFFLGDRHHTLRDLYSIFVSNVTSGPDRSSSIRSGRRCR
jgi:hypothetical protein